LFFFLICFVGFVFVFVCLFVFFGGEEGEKIGRRV